MTVHLSENSSRGMAAARFGAELRKAMQARKVGALRLCEASGVAKSAIGNWKAGLNRNTLAFRQGMKGGVPKFDLEIALIRYGRSEARRVQRRDKALEQIAGLRELIDAMCRGCEPEGLCRTAECPLRPASPLPLQERGARAEIRDVLPYTEERREAQVARNARRWSRAGERERASDVMRARHAAMTPEDREAWVERIRVTKAERSTAPRRHRMPGDSPGRNRVGPVRALPPAEVEAIRVAWSAGAKVRDLAQAHGITVRSVYRYLELPKAVPA